MRYYTYKVSALARIKPGQTLRFEKGKGYWLSGAPTQPPKPAPASKPYAMFDSVNVENLPAGKPAYAGYIGGSWPNYPQVVKRFPNALHLSVAVASRYDADCLDVEQGDATNATAVPWVKRQHARGVKQPVLYTFLANAQTMIDTLARNGVPWGTYKLWIAHWTYHPHICNSFCGLGLRHTAHATQWTNKSGGHSLDESLCSPGFIEVKGQT